ncbi:MAG: TM0106 family RecB-like putative nuclease [Propionibacteriaceae bacterium]|nr:TM0106 family RecB-like putative nuclease [Propionibacteriaceae bacterium]
MKTPKAFALDRSAVTFCPVSVQSFARVFAQRDEPLDMSLQRFELPASTHHAHVVRTLIAHHGREAVDLSGIKDGEARTSATVQAMEQGASLIIAPRPPTDWSNHRSGTIDLLVHAGEPTQSYYPVLVKDYPILDPGLRKTGGQRASRLSRPFLAHAEPTSHTLRDHDMEINLLHLAHLWHLLDDCGFAPTHAWAGLIGTDHEDQVWPDQGGAHKGHVITWINLKEKALSTISRTSTSGWKTYSPLERYDHEFRFRVRVAERALTQGASCEPLIDKLGEGLMVSPIRIDQCDHCDWWKLCQESLGDDISMNIERPHLDPREITTLRSLGITTIDDLATADIDAILEDYLPQVSYRSDAEHRFRVAAHRTRLIHQGIPMERITSTAIDVPRADIEIDWDIETSSHHRAYLWGFLIHDRRTPTPGPSYHCFSKFSALNQTQELHLGLEALSWLKSYIAAQGKTSVLIYHYSSSELLTVQRLAQFLPQDREARGSAALDWFTAWSQEHCVDLQEYVTRHFFSVDGWGLKTVATHGAGFSWRETDASGLNSMRWFDEATDSSASPDHRNLARERIERYNEDDVRATWALRHWLSSLDETGGTAALVPGS